MPLFEAHRAEMFQADYLMVDETRIQVLDPIEVLPNIERAACLAHARRKFKDALKNDPKPAQEALFLIQSLYAIEAQARDNHLSHSQRLELRPEKAQPIWIKEKALDPTILQKSPIGKALSYTAQRIPCLAKYLTDGKLEIDNNLAENAIRPINQIEQLLPKNWKPNPDLPDWIRFTPANQ
jgi:hypothetical protein